jgi:hypothetical protein
MTNEIVASAINVANVSGMGWPEAIALIGVAFAVAWLFRGLSGK